MTGSASNRHSSISTVMLGTCGLACWGVRTACTVLGQVGWHAWVRTACTVLGQVGWHVGGEDSLYCTRTSGLACLGEATGNESYDRNRLDILH